MRRVPAALLGLFMLAAVVPLAAREADAAPEGDAAPFVHAYRGAEIPLTLDATRLAIFRVERGGAGRAKGLPALGIDGSAETPHAIAGWSLVRVDDAGRAKAGEGPRGLVRAAAEDPSVDFASPVFIDDLGGAMFPTRDILVRLRPEAVAGRGEAVLAPAGDVLARDWAEMPGVFVVRSRSRSGGEVLDEVARLRARPEVEWAEADMVFTGRAELTPNDPGYANCWGLHNMGQEGGTADQDMDAPEAWDTTIGVPAIITVIIDTGVDPTHPDLNQVSGIDATIEGPSGMGAPGNSFERHGTAVAGCVSAIINNNLGTVGIAPGTRIASARAFIGTNDQGSWTSQSSWTVSALAFAQTIGARVTNNSNGYGFTSTAIDAKYDQTRNAGIVHFASAGNDGSSSVISYPARVPGVNAVGAVTPSGLQASFSNAGSSLFIAAPGTSVYTTDRQGAAGYFGGDYGSVQGTSFASPYAAGVAALVLSVKEQLGAADVENILAASAVDRGAPGRDTVYGWGFVNARAALNLTNSFSAPGPFNLLSPSQGATQVKRRPSLDWARATFATSYQVMVDDNADFSSPVLWATVPLPPLEVPGPGLLASTTYFWRVEARNAVGSTLSSPASGSFTTISTPPASPVLNSPASGAVGVTQPVTLSWGWTARAESYRVLVDDNQDLSSPILDTTTTATQATITQALAGLRTYYWSVWAVNPLGSTASSPALASFTTLGVAPGDFNLTEPLDGTSVQTRTPTLRWTWSSDVDSYRVVIDDQQDLSSPVYQASGLTSTSHVVPAGVLSNGVRYYWQVRAQNSVTTTISTPWLFSFAVVLSTCEGDADGNRLVNFADITAVLLNFRNAGPVGDADGNGAVDFADITTVLLSFANSCPG